MMDELFDVVILGNHLWRYVIFASCLLVAVVIARLIRWTMRSIDERIQESCIVTKAALKAVRKSLTGIFFAIAFDIGQRILMFDTASYDAIRTVTEVLYSVAIGMLLVRLSDVPAAKIRKMAEASENKLDNMIVPLVSRSLGIIIGALVLVHIAQILSDRPMTSILAGLGVGGLAVALAGQETIRNLFGSVMISLDKPFDIGDRIVVDGFDGPVKEVGLRSTRIETLEGHTVTIPNGELANRTIQNIGRRQYIRRLFTIGVTYGTPPEKVDRAIAIIKELLDNHEGMKEDFPPRVYFNGFGDYSLNILVIYWYHPPAYWDFMAHAEKLNTEILRRFNADEISFAFPTQTLHLVKDDDGEESVIPPGMPMSGK